MNRSVIKMIILSQLLIVTLVGIGLIFWVYASPSSLLITHAHLGAPYAEIRTEQPGRLSQVFYDEGSYVKQGDLLFSLNCDEEKEKQKRLLETVASLQEKLTYSMADSEQAMQDYFTAKSEVEMGLVPADRVEALLTILQEQQAKTNECQQQLSATKNDLAKFQELFQKRSVFAPFSGVIVKQEKCAGDVVFFGDKVYSMFDPGSIWVDAIIDEKDMTKVQMGQKASIRLVADKSKKWEGEVSWISPIALPSQEGIPIRISLSKNDDLLVRPNLSAEVRIFLTR